MCVKVVNEMNGKLVEAYKKWYDELSKKASQLLGDNYSNPYYIGIPEDWTDAALKIMVIGEEGNGFWGCGKNDPQIDPCTDEGIKKIQAWNLAYLGRQLDSKDNPQEGNFLHWNSSRFWKRIRNLQKNIDNVSFIWNNMDKIHYTPRDGDERKKCHLNPDERKALHSCKIHILQREIEITKPDIVIFFGIYWDDKKYNALRAELEEVGKEVDEKDGNWNEKYKCVWGKYRIIYLKEKFDCGGEPKDITFVFTWHPGYYKGCTKDYETAVVNAVKEALGIK